MENNKNKVLKIFISLRKEQQWLEEMALKGWKLTNIDIGIWYTFTAIEPKKLVYEIDRFLLPKHPTMKEIKHKEEFLEMAQEMGWEVIVHDEDLNYYFCKEYIDGDINELHNDLESRQLRAETFRTRYQYFGKNLTGFCIFMAIIGLLWTYWIPTTHGEFSYPFFSFLYVIVVLIMGLIFENVGDYYYNELMLSKEEWKEALIQNNENTKVVIKLLSTNRSLMKYLRKQSKEGWHISLMTSTRYVFKKGEPEDYIYTLDCNYFVNKRNKENGKSKVMDRKDWIGNSNDWQLQSVKEAELKAWNYVCAFRNKYILYRSKQADNVISLNQSKNTWIPFIGIIGIFTVFLTCCFIIGFVCGLVLALI